MPRPSCAVGTARRPECPLRRPLKPSRLPGAPSRPAPPPAIARLAVPSAPRLEADVATAHRAWYAAPGAPSNLALPRGFPRRRLLRDLPRRLRRRSLDLVRRSLPLLFRSLLLSFFTSHFSLGSSGAREASPGALGVGASLGSEVGSGSSTGAPSAGGNLPAVAGGAFGGVFGTATGGLTRCGAPPANCWPLPGPPLPPAPCLSRAPGGCPGPGSAAPASVSLGRRDYAPGAHDVPAKAPHSAILVGPAPSLWVEAHAQEVARRVGSGNDPILCGSWLLVEDRRPLAGHEQHAGRLVRLGNALAALGRRGARAHDGLRAAGPVLQSGHLASLAWQQGRCRDRAAG